MPTLYGKTIDEYTKEELWEEIEKNWTFIPSTDEELDKEVDKFIIQATKEKLFSISGGTWIAIIFYVSMFALIVNGVIVFE